MEQNWELEDQRRAVESRFANWTDDGREFQGPIHAVQQAMAEVKHSRVDDAKDYIPQKERNYRASWPDDGPYLSRLASAFVIETFW